MTAAPEVTTTDVATFTAGSVTTALQHHAARRAKVALSPANRRQR